MGFVDTHVHLHFPDFDSDRAEVMKRAQSAGADCFINVGTDLESSKASIQLAEAHSNVYATVGVHPHDAKDATPQSLKAITELARHPRVVAIGEVGLDYFRDHSPRETQKEIFRFFLKLHREVGKALVIHCRDAYQDLADFLITEMKPPFRGVMHCFSSDTDTMKRFLDLGFYISFAGPLTYKKNDGLRDACRTCPLDRLLLETDAPFLPPQSLRGKRNESAFLLETAKVASDLLGITLKTLGERTRANAETLFRLC